MLNIFNSIISFLSEGIVYILKLIVYLFNLVLWIFSSLVNLLLGLFPPTPFSISEIVPNIDEYISYLNWFLPINRILDITFAWAGCMLIYWGFCVVMRWIKLID